MAMAARAGGTIINGDASQLYADLRIITARPSLADEAAVPHRLYGVLDGLEIASAAAWAAMAKAAIAETRAEGRVPIIVGGTGLYLTTLLDGIAPVPDIDPAVRALVRALPTDAAAAALAAEDAALAARLHPTDRQRVLRGLEVVRSTGHSLLAWQTSRSGGIAADFDIFRLVVERPRIELHARAGARLAAMVDEGAMVEVAKLLARALPDDRPIMRALGVREFSAVIAGDLLIEAGIAAAAQATRQYQKRQATWGRSQAGDWPRLATGDEAALIDDFTRRAMAGRR